MITATKEVSFACAHMLAGHNGLCKNLHGHNYKVQVTVGRITGQLKNGGSSDGMVMDFKDLKKAINDLIVEPYDHAYVIDATLGMSAENEAAIKIAETVQALELKHVMFPGRATAERMSEVFGNQLKEALEKDDFVKVLSVKVWETDTSYAEWTREDI